MCVDTCIQVCTHGRARIYVCVRINMCLFFGCACLHKCLQLSYSVACPLLFVHVLWSHLYRHVRRKTSGNAPACMDKLQTNTHTFTYTYACESKRTYAYTYTYTHTCECACAYPYTYTHMHTHTHAHAQRTTRFLGGGSAPALLNECPMIFHLTLFSIRV